MKPIRVLAGNRPRQIRALVIDTISDQPDMEVVGEVQEESAVVTVLDHTQPGPLILELERHDPRRDFCPSILQGRSQVKIIAIAPDRNSSICGGDSLRLQSIQIAASEAGVLNALQGTTQPPGRVQ